MSTGYVLIVDTAMGVILIDVEDVENLDKNEIWHMQVVGNNERFHLPVCIGITPCKKATTCIF